MKKHILTFGLSSIAGLVVGAVLSFFFLREKLESAIEEQKRISRRMDEMKQTLEDANTQVLILQAELDLRQDQWRRLLGDEGDWRGSN